VARARSLTLLDDHAGETSVKRPAGIALTPSAKKKA